ncbi:elongation of fatty acids protein 3-like [Cornus florida]|uniref:elongation of fatty acids protein 3-like n=1 Tax=Cornus florida TaxID=4283 RepID=UPI0028A0BE99|nr:elongation of fatty acids protein 3-like [Cornus florida]
MVPLVIQSMQYWLSEHPKMVTFRWNTQLWGSTWLFLLTSISFYITAAVTLHHLLLPLFLRRRSRPVPLGPIPALHSLAMTLISAAIFAGTLSSVAAEIRDTRWLWQRSKTPFQWLLCFPLGTRSSGRVFFWSYVFYLSRFLLPLRTFFVILRRRTLPHIQLFYDSIFICMSFLWLEFSQSFQVFTILCVSLMYSMVFGYGFWAELGFPGPTYPGIVIHCQMFLLGCNLVFHVGAILLHFFKGGCNGIGVGFVNFVLNAVTFFMFFKFYVKMHLPIRMDVTSKPKSSSETKDEFANGKDKDD